MTIGTGGPKVPEARNISARSALTPIIQKHPNEGLGDARSPAERRVALDGHVRHPRARVADMGG